jgi:hypothetical protein
MRKSTARSCPCAGCGAVIVSAGLLPREPGHACCVACVDRDPGATFGLRLRAHRLAAGLTFAELARRSGGISREHPRLGTGAHDPPVKTRARLAEALGVTVGRLGLRASPGESGKDKRSPCRRG